MLIVFLIHIPVSDAFSQTFYVQPTGGTVELEIKQPESSLERIYFDLSDQSERFVLKVHNAQGDRGRVYDRFLINATGLQSEPESVVFDIRVNRSWIIANNINSDTLALYMYDEEWGRLVLVPFSEDQDYLRFRVSSPKLRSSFALVGEQVLVDFDVRSPCNRDDVCDVELGETEENCPDCFPEESISICIPSQKYCSGGYLFTCNEDGSDYSFKECPFGCADDACILGTTGPLAGMVVATNPVIIPVIVVLLVAVIYLAVLAKRMRKQITRAEERRISHEDVKAITKAERDSNSD